MTRCCPTTPAELSEGLREVRGLLCAMVDDLDDAPLDVPCLDIVNPFLWELGHSAWFLERWVLRHLDGRESLLGELADCIYDSSAVAHRSRWLLELPDRERTARYVGAVFDEVLGRLEGLVPTPDELYFHRLGLFHADMHVEAFVYMRQTLGLPPPAVARGRSTGAEGPCPGMVALAGGSFELGAPREATFVFDNEQWAHPVDVPPFRLSRAPVTQAEYRAFVEDDGYRRRELWSPAGWGWRSAVAAEYPVYWRPDGAGGWERRGFDAWGPLEEHLPVHHVSAYEADAFCRWAGRRLPTEAEWEYAAQRTSRPWGEDPVIQERAHLDLAAVEVADVGACAAGDTPDGLRQLWGNVWEWTASVFAPYPGFEPGPYRDYSLPWFGDHRVLRGGAFATRSRHLASTWRNYYRPERRDVLAGFRTAADAE